MKREDKSFFRRDIYLQTLALMGVELDKLLKNLFYFV